MLKVKFNLNIKNILTMIAIGVIVIVLSQVVYEKISEYSNNNYNQQLEIYKEG